MNLAEIPFLTSNLPSIGQTVLSLPRLDGVPAELSLRPEQAIWAKLAIWCDNIGMLTENDWLDAKNAKDVFICSLSRWVNQNLTTKHLTCNWQFDFVETVCSFSETDYKDVLRERNQNPDEPHLAVVFSKDGTLPQFVIEEKVMLLEKHIPGLGETALSLLRNAAFRSVDLIDPARILHLAAMIYWYGEDDEAVFLEENGLEDDESVMRRSDFDAYAPAFAWNPSDRIKQDQLSNIEQDVSQPEWIREVAKVLHSLDKILSVGVESEQWTGFYSDEFYGIGAALWWRNEENSIMVQVWDDYDNQIFQRGDGYIDAFGVDTFPITQAGFHQWIESKKRWFGIVECLDNLIDLIGTRIV